MRSLPQGGNKRENDRYFLTGLLDFQHPGGLISFHQKNSGSDKFGKVIGFGARCHKAVSVGVTR